MEEQIRLRNRTGATIHLAKFRGRISAVGRGQVGPRLPELAGDRWVAVPLRHRADFSRVLDFSLAELIAEPGQEYRPAESWRRKKVVRRGSSRGRRLGLDPWRSHTRRLQLQSGNDVLQCRGGREGPGRCHSAVRRRCHGLRANRRHSRGSHPGRSSIWASHATSRFAGGFVPAAYAFRALLDEKVAAFPPATTRPFTGSSFMTWKGPGTIGPTATPAPWWRKRQPRDVITIVRHFTSIPGWDTSFGSFLWGQDWLGPQEEFAEQDPHDLRSEAGSPLPHAPVGLISPGMSMGPFKPEDWPAACRRHASGSPRTTS